MSFEAIFDPEVWARVPFHFWSMVFFVFGCIVGSFLNVVIHRLPLEQSIIRPPSHCPHCKYSIPWYLNIPLVTWVWLGGKCRNCGASISIRYFLVELLTGATFLGCWLAFGGQSAALALIYCLFLAALIAATFIDYAHFIIPDEITIGGVVAGFMLSLILPRLHGVETVLASVGQCLLGAAVGAGIIYAILRAGKLMFGRQRLVLPGETRIIFGETCVHLPDKEIPYEELFYRPSDAITLEARTVELPDRCYRNVPVRLALLSGVLRIGEEEMDPGQITHLEAVTSEVVMPREAMGLGDVKFMGLIGAFLGWQAVLFTLMISSVLGSAVGLTLMALGKRQPRLPYGPYIAIAAACWLFGGWRLWDMLWTQGG